MRGPGGCFYGWVYVVSDGDSGAGFSLWPGREILENFSEKFLENIFGAEKKFEKDSEGDLLKIFLLLVTGLTKYFAVRDGAHEKFLLKGAPPPPHQNFLLRGWGGVR